MKKILPHIVFLFCTNVLLAQAPEIEWAKCFGGSNYDEAHCIKQTTDGGYIVGGQRGSFDGDLTGLGLTGGYWVLKINSAGEIVWNKCYGGSTLDIINSIALTNDGGYILAGISTSIDGDVSGNHGGGDYWIVKINSIGLIEWSKCYGGSGYDEANAIYQTSDEGYIIVGRSASVDGDITGHHGFDMNYDYWVVKINNSGGIEWQNTLGGNSDDYATCALETGIGSFIISGFSASNSGDVSFNHGGYDYWIINLDSSGGILWQKTFGGLEDDLAYSLTKTSDENIVVGGLSLSNDGDVSGNHSTLWSDAWIIKLNISGDLLWQKCLGGTQGDGAYSLKETWDNGIIIGAISDSDDGDLTEHYGTSGHSDYWIIELDSATDIHWQKSFGGSETDEAFSIDEATDSGYVIAGYSFSTDYDVIGHFGLTLNRDWWIVKLSPPCIKSLFYADDDGDGYGNISLDSLACIMPSEYVTDSTDCNDTNNLIYPTATDICNALDDNCNGLIDEDVIFTTWFADMDDDGFGDAMADSISCLTITGFVADSTDCNDADPLTHPLVEESCNGIDDNCNLSIDEGLSTQTLFADSDDDGFGNPLIDTVTCFTGLTGYVSDSTDCNDTNPLIYPGAPELLNGLDDNCNQLIDEGLGISDNNSTAFTIFPNPVTSNITIQFASPISHPEIKIFNSTGQLVYEQQIPQTTNEFTISGIELPAGSYFLRVVKEGAVEMGKFEVVRE